MIDTLILSDVYVGVTIKGISDITDIRISLKNTLTSVVISYSMANGDIIISGDSVVWHIEDTSISVAGIYEIAMIVVNTNGDKLPMQLNEDYVRFK